MTNDKKVSLSSRPSKMESRAETVSKRPERQKMGSLRDKLTVKGMDPSFNYRWVKDECVDTNGKDGDVIMKVGQRVMMFQDAGWSFVEAGTVKIGENGVYKTQNVGSIVRLPAGQNEFLFLMRIDKDWYIEDQVEKEQNLLDVEKSYSGSNSEDGMYGSVKTDYN